MTEPQPTGGALDPKLLEILVCPVTKKPLRYDRDKGELMGRGRKSLSRGGAMLALSALNPLGITRCASALMICMIRGFTPGNICAV